ncbi:hypothetical protein FEM48_Zijuj07G0032900 [Ziziphus jujuba var. spinosa]|uniref:Brix domain-containing protein n=1 Tax=Ziziphus jujuba var. spinosa TaxID=714518 RepID=A0A978V252_ZIZJJ|nr:hypothetical protein FEM48_Zijuj07G0032900 [Ziziphus jujuba var. spinosa]
MLKAKYLQNETFFGYTLKRETSWVWQGIVKSRKLLRKGSCFRIGDGTSIDLWKDPWIPRLPNNCPIAKEEADITNWRRLYEIWDDRSHSWNESVIRHLCNVEMTEAILRIDKNAWKENATLLFDKEEQNQRNPFKELKFDFPNAQQMNQAGGGKGLFLEIIEICCTCDFTDVVLVHEHRGVPARLIISHLPFGPTACFHLLNADKKTIGTMHQAYPHLVPNIAISQPRSQGEQFVIVSIINFHITDHIYEKHGSEKSIELKEIGLRFELQLFRLSWEQWTKVEHRLNG